MSNPLVYFNDMQDMRVVQDVSAFVLGKIDQVAKQRLAANERRYLDTISRMKERERSLANRSARLEQELKRVQTRSGLIGSMARSIFNQIPPEGPPEKKVIMNLDGKANFEKMTANIRVEKTSDHVVFNCRMDPQLLLPRLDVPAGQDIKLEIELDTAMDVPVQVFWAKKQGAFTEEASVRRSLRHDLSKVDVLLKPDSSPIFLRVDLGDGGERYIFKTLRVLA